MYGRMGGTTLLAVPGVRVIVAYLLSLIGLYPVIYHGIVTGSTSASAAANTTALAALWLSVATAGGGTILWSAGTFPLNATTLDHALSSNPSMNMQGLGSSARIELYGTTGPFLNVASGSTSSIARCIWRDLRIDHKATPTSGATLQFGHSQQIVLDNIRMPAVSSSLASFNPIRLAASANGFHILNSKFETQSTGAITPIGLDVAVSTGTCGGLVILNTDFSGYQNNSIGIRFVNTIDWDTVWLGPGTLLKDHETGFLKSAGGAKLSNVIMNGAVIDAVAGAAVQLDAPASSTIENVQITGCWLKGTDYGVLLAESSGTMAGVQITGTYITDATAAGVSVGTGVDSVLLVGNRIATNISDAGNWAVDVNGTSANVLIASNLISAGATAAGLVRISANVDPVVLNGNILRGGADADGISFGSSTDASHVNANNAYLS